MTEERRRGMDEILEQIVVMRKEILDNTRVTAEIHQRQREITIPRLERLEHCLHGNDSPGLLREHEVCQGRIKVCEESIKRAEAWIIGLLTTGLIGFFSYIALHIMGKV